MNKNQSTGTPVPSVINKLILQANELSSIPLLTEQLECLVMRTYRTRTVNQANQASQLSTQLAAFSHWFNHFAVFNDMEKSIYEVVFSLEGEYYCAYCKDRELIKINHKTYQPGVRKICETLILGNITGESVRAWAREKLDGVYESNIAQL